jgi:hypothetical protein
MTRRWFPPVLAVAGAIALAIVALGRYSRLDGLHESVALVTLGPSLACLAAAIVAGFAPAFRMVAAGALIALGVVRAWVALWSAGWEAPTTEWLTTLGAVLVTLAGVLLIRGQHSRDMAA